MDDIDKLAEKLTAYAGEDHMRGCDGRNYKCTCDYLEDGYFLLTQAAATLLRLRDQRDEAREARDEVCRLNDMLIAALGETP